MRPRNQECNCSVRCENDDNTSDDDETATNCSKPDRRFSTFLKAILKTRGASAHQSQVCRKVKKKSKIGAKRNDASSSESVIESPR